MGVSLGVKAADCLSSGCGVQYGRGFAELSKVQDFAAVNELGDGLTMLGQENDFNDMAPTEVRELDTLARPLSLKNAWSHMVTFNVGVAARPTKRLGLNLAYEHSTPMKFKGDVAVDMNDPFFTQDLADQGVKFPPLIEGDATLEFILPKRLTLGVSFDINEKFRVDGFGQLSFYSQLKSFGVTMVSEDLVQPELGIGDTAIVDLKRDWNNTVWVEGSFRARVATRWLVSATLGYMSPASPDSTVDLSSIDGHRPLGALGTVFDINDRWSLYSDLRLQGIIPRTVTESDYDLGNGTYKLFIASLGLHARARF
jgi:long-chain fatty acid transport protein